MPLNERRIHQVFKFSVILKGLLALMECIGGVLLYVFSTASIAGLVNLLTQEELVEDPQDFIAMHLQSWAEHLSIGTQHFYAFYLLSHGVIKLLLVIGLLKNRLWAYPASLAVLAAFIGYQLYRYSYTHSFGLIVLTVFDLFVMVLIWHEYRLLRDRTARTATRT